MQRAFLLIAMAASAAAFAPASAPLALRSSKFAAATARPTASHSGLVMKAGEKFEMAPGVGLPLGQSLVLPSAPRSLPRHPIILETGFNVLESHCRAILVQRVGLLRGGNGQDMTPFVLLQVMALGVMGWVVPTLLVPSNIPLYKGLSLTGAFASSIGENLAKFPAPPGVTDPFWLLCFIWHSG
jgi:photosystem I protein PsaO